MAQTVRLNRSQQKQTIGGNDGNDNNKIWTYAIAGALLVLIILLILVFTSRGSGNSKAKAPQGIEERITRIEYTDGPYAPQTSISQTYSITKPQTYSTAEAQGNGQTGIESSNITSTENADVTEASVTHPVSSNTNESSKQSSDDKAVQKADDNKDENAGSTLNLGYAKYEGKISKGVPHGRGKLTFTTSHVIDSYDPERRMAAAGDVVTGMFYDGHLTQGKIVRADGTTERIMIGN